MLTPGPAAGNTVAPDSVTRRGSSAWPRTVLYAAPVVVIAVYGALWIALHGGGGRGSMHTLFQSLALAESLFALLMRGRKPVGALAGIVAVYVVFALDPLLLPAVLVALLTVAAERDQRTAAIAAAATAAATVTWPYLGGHAFSFAWHSLPRLAAFAIAVAAGMYLRQRRNRRGRHLPIPG
jgi:hypothetical protein